jgi:hypothetical protein
MQTICLKVNDNYLDTVLTLIDSLKIDMIKDIQVIPDTTSKDMLSSDESQVLDSVKGILQDRITDPIEYQRVLRS